MKMCRLNHAEIVYFEKYCPLCNLREERKELVRTINSLKRELYHIIDRDITAKLVLQNLKNYSEFK